MTLGDMSLNPAVSIVTGTRNRPDSFLRFVRSLDDHMRVPFELIVTDASDEPGEYTSDLQPWKNPNWIRTELIPQKPRLGPIRGYNPAFKACAGEWVVWFNDDVEILPGWDETAIAYLTEHPEIGIGCVYFRDHAGDGLRRSFVIQSLNGLMYPNFGFFRREFGERIGWFSEDIGFFYGGDTDYGFKAVEAGKAVVGIPGCKVLHYREQDAERVNNLVTARQDQDRAKFDAKWPAIRCAKLREIMKRFSHFPNARAIQ